MAERDEVTVHIEAPPERIYELISDVTRMGEWSPETYSAEWVDGATGPAVGARFKGRNKAGFLRWSTTPEVIAADPGREFAFVTKFGRHESTRWRYVMKPAGSGTAVTESWELLWQPLPMRVIGNLLGRRKMLTEGMRSTLQDLKRAAEAAA